MGKKEEKPITEKAQETAIIARTRQAALAPRAPTTSKTKMSAMDKMRIAGIFQEDMEAIKDAMHDQLAEAYGHTRELVLNRAGIKEMVGEAADLEKDIDKLKLELQRLREEMNFKIVQKEQRLRQLKAENLGEYHAPAEPEVLRQLDFDEDDKTKGRTWMGFPINTRLDAMVALELKKQNVEAPAAAVMTIFRAVQREFAFTATYEDAARVYGQFYALNFREYGVNIPPRLQDLKRLTGKDLLDVGFEEDKKMLIPPSELSVPVTPLKEAEAKQIGFAPPELPSGKPEGK